MNRKSRHYAHLFAATDLSQSLRSALEFSVGVAALMLVTAIAVHNLQTAILRAQTVESITLISTARVDLVAHHAVHGEWPSSTSELASPAFEEGKSGGRYVDRIELDENGAMTVVFDTERSAEDLRGAQITYRPSALADRTGTPIVFACGRHKVIDGFTASGVDRTNLEPLSLPSVCREH